MEVVSSVTIKKWKTCNVQRAVIELWMHVDACRKLLSRKKRQGLLEALCALAFVSIHPWENKNEKCDVMLPR